MTQISQSESPTHPGSAHPESTPGPAGTLFGVPLGDLGWFATLLMSCALGMAAFFLTTFFAIFAILFYNTFTHHNVDYALTYRVVGLPIGVTVLVVALVYLGSLWVRRMLRRA